MPDPVTPTAPAAAPAVDTTPTQNTGTAPAPGQVKEPTAAPKPMTASEEFYEVKVNGQTKRLTRDQLIKKAELGYGADERFQEAATLTKKAQSVLENMTDPRKAIKFLQDPKLGLNKDEVRGAFEEWYRTEYIDREAMTPEQRKLADAEARIAEFEAERDAVKKQEEDAENEKLDAVERKRILTETIAIIEEHKLPKTKFAASRIAYWTRINETKGLNAPRGLIAQQVQKEAQSIFRSMVDASDGEVFESLAGQEIIKKVRKMDLEKLRQKRAGSSPAKPKSPRPEKKLRSADVNYRLREFRLGRKR